MLCQSPVHVSPQPLPDLLQQAGVAGPPYADLKHILVRGVTDDSRRVENGFLFVAVAGVSHDGHGFLAQAQARGAVAAVVQHDPAPDATLPLIHVPDSAAAFARLASAFCGLSPLIEDGRLQLIGVTGTNGKSTTGFLIQALLRAAGRPTALLGTVRYDLVGETRPAPWTTPPAGPLAECLMQAWNHGARHAVLEVSSHALRQRRTAGVCFQSAVFTNLSGDHLDYHHDFEDYLNAKKLLFDGLSPSSRAIVNADDPQAEPLLADCPARVIRFGLRRDVEVTAEDIVTRITGTQCKLRLGNRRIAVDLPLVGRHNLSNALAAAAAGLAADLAPELIQQALSAAPQVAGRLQRTEPPGHPFSVFVDYAHSDDALDNVLSALRPLTPGRLWCVFGCGGDRDRSKRPRMGQVSARYADRTVITSDNPRHEDPQAIIADILEGLPGCEAPAVVVEADRRAAIRCALQGAAAGDVVLIAGKGHEDYQIVGRQRLHFDDAEVVCDYFKPDRRKGTGLAVGTGS